jgi:cation diffusion facilitator CzcD-associated flavoprotein CzcO
MLDVAVIGAGAAGLVSTRHLLRCGLNPIVFESGVSPGGAWNPSAGPTVRKMWDHLHPNLSRWTCCFSDFPWEKGTPAYPSRSDLHQYLDRYAEHFVDPKSFRYGCTVTQVNRIASSQSYNVEWVEDGESRSQEFEGVVVATGFFSTPILPEGLLGEEEYLPGRVLHSSRYKSPSDFHNQTVAVIGSSFSAHEIAVDVRKSAARVVNILPRIPWVLPRYVPYGNGFLPLDMVLYQRNTDAPQTPQVICLTKESCRKRHAFLRDLVGVRKQSVLGLPEDDSSPPMVSISDDYLNLVISGDIDVVKGRLARASTVSGQDDSTPTMEIELQDGKVVSGIDSIIACTGYRSRLDFLDSDILKTLQYDESDEFAPLTLCYDAFHPSLPGLGFVGMHKGPYFGTMELQARLVAGLLSEQVKPSDEAVAHALETSQTIRQHRPRAQFPHFDYVGLMDTMAEQLDLVPTKEYGAKGSFVSPAFYQPSDEISRNCKEDLEEEVLQATEKGANIPRIVMSALVGKWSFHRTITEKSAAPSKPQTITGEVNFSLQGPFWDVVLYREDGTFELPNGNILEVFREYEYVSKNDTLEIYFREDGRRALLFLSLKFEKKKNGFWVATSDHLCIKDLYKGTFTVAFDGISASEVNMTYRVKGPNKDYESVTSLRPK